MSTLNARSMAAALATAALLAALLAVVGLTVAGPVSATNGGAPDTEVADTDEGANPAAVAEQAPTAGPATSTAVVDEATYRAAIIALSADGSGPHTINITASFTISTAGDPTYTGTQALTIEGNGNTVDSTGVNTLFLENNSTASTTIRNLTVTGFRHDGEGGAVKTEGDVTVASCTFTDNATTDGDDGGAIESDGDITVTDCTFTGNSAEEGGALHSEDEGAVTVSNSRFVDNTADDEGGAINSESDTQPITVAGSTFTGNESDDNDGGAISSDGEADVVVSGSTFRDNEARGDDDGGGAIGTDDGDVSLTDSTADANSAEGNGGGIDSAGDVTLIRSTVSNNNAGEEGGGVWANLDLSADSSTISGNEAVLNGGGADVFNAALINSTVTGNTSGGTGGGLNASGEDDVSLAYVTLASNGAPTGANVEVESDVPLATLASTFSDPQGGGDNCDLALGSNSGGHNQSSDVSCELTGTADVENAADPQLGALADNGGSTLTRLPATGSPLIDAVAEADCIAADQRGVTRPQDGNRDGTTGCDVGAVEVESPPPPVTGPITATPTFTG